MKPLSEMTREELWGLDRDALIELHGAQPAIEFLDLDICPIDCLDCWEYDRPDILEALDKYRLQLQQAPIRTTTKRGTK